MAVKDKDIECGGVSQTTVAYLYGIYTVYAGRPQLKENFIEWYYTYVMGGWGEYISKTGVC